MADGYIKVISCSIVRPHPWISRFSARLQVGYCGCFKLFGRLFLDTSYEFFCLFYTGHISSFIQQFIAILEVNRPTRQIRRIIVRCSIRSSYVEFTSHSGGYFLI